VSSKRGSLESPYTQKTKDPTHPYSLFGISYCHCYYLRRNVPPGRSYQSQIFFELASGGISGKHRDKCWCCLLKFSCLEPIVEMVQNNTKFICNCWGNIPMILRPTFYALLYLVSIASPKLATFDSRQAQFIHSLRNSNRSRRPALSSKGNRDVNSPRIHTKPTLINRTTLA
jgi:hypothetical protein